MPIDWIRIGCNCPLAALAFALCPPLDAAGPPRELRLAHGLARTGSEAHRSPAIVAAQRRLAAALDEPGTAPETDPQLRAAQDRIRLLQSEIERLQQRNQSDQALLNQIRKTSEAPPWRGGMLAGAFLVALAVLGWLARQARRKARGA